MGQQGAIERQRLASSNSDAADIGLMQAQAQALQGNIQAAQATVDRAIDLKYKTQEAKIDTWKFQYAAIQDQLSTAENKQGEAQLAYMNNLQQQIAEKKTAEKDRYNTINQMTLDGYSYIASPSQLRGLSEGQITRIKDQNGQDMIFKNPPMTISGGGGGVGGGVTTVGGKQIVDSSGKPIKLTATQVDTVSGFENTLKQIQGIKPLISQVNTGPISGRWSSIARMVGLDDPKRIELDAKFNSIKAAYLKALSGAAVSESEVKRLSTFLPSINDTEEVVAIKISELEQSINNQKNSFMDALGAVEQSTNDPVGLNNDPLGIR